MKKIIFIVLLFLVTTARSQKVDSLMGIAQQYLSGLMKPYEPKKAFEIFTQCANLGNAKAMNAIGVQYKLGLGIDTNNMQAFNWFQKSAASGYATAWYNLGMMYKQGNGCNLNYSNAYTCFKKAADMQDGGGIYAQGYMLYKGFGCTQDYKKAIALFKKGVAVNKASCMYLLGLCFRNGYGIAANADSAQYWLNKSASFGYQFALDELATKEPENSYNPNLLIEKVRAIEANASKNTSFNQYRKVEQSISVSDIEGIYSGYLIKYDWSGEHIIAVNKLNITLTYAANKLTGLWVEDDSLSVVLNASITPKFLTFENSQYSKIDHYNIVPEQLNFEKAILGLIHDKDSVYLTGNVQLYSPERKEPERPLYLVLSRTTKSNSSDTAFIHFANEIKANTLKVYPNPFTSSLSIDFELKEASEVYTQLFTTDGRLLYTNKATRLEAGNYTLPVQFTVPNGLYVVKLHCGKDTKTASVLKQ